MAEPWCEGAGSLVTRRLDYDGGRDVTVWVPADPPTGVVYAGDGGTLAAWGADLTSATMVVGVHRAADETQRLHEYSPGFDPRRFADHEAFLVGEVRSWVADRFGVALPPGRTAAYGVSAGAELALALGVRRPDVVGVVLAASPGAGYRPPEVLPRDLRAYLVAGDREPFFRDNAARWAEALAAAAHDVVLAERAGEHGGAFWRRELPAMVAWAWGTPVGQDVAVPERTTYRFDPEDGVPPPVGPFAHAVRWGDTLFVTGQMPTDPTTGELVAGGLVDQARRVRDNLAAVLARFDATLDDALMVRVYLTDFDDFAAFNTEYASWFHAPLPARTTVGVTGLAVGARVEIDLVVGLRGA